MGYTIGRRLTFDVLEQIAKKYHSRSQFQKLDSSAYVTARTAGILNAITKHMVNVSFSIPQLITQYILDRVLNCSSLYNTRKIITPYEIDIYYPSLNLAIEYNGKGWHTDEDAQRRDKIKKSLLKEKNIFSVILFENNRNYETDVKQQLSSNIEFLQKFNINAQSIIDCKIDWDKIFKNTTVAEKTKQIKLIIDNCTSLKQFRTQFKREYGYIQKHKLHHLMTNLSKMTFEYTDDELLNIAKTYNLYKDFVKTKYYNTCHKRGLLKDATSDMKLTKERWSHYSDEDIIKMVKDTGCQYPSDLKKIMPHLHNTVKKRHLKIWTKRKCKYDPFEIKNKVYEILATGKNINYIKDNYSSLYSVYSINRKKGIYGPHEPKGKGSRVICQSA